MTATSATTAVMVTAGKTMTMAGGAAMATVATVAARAAVAAARPAAKRHLSKYQYT
jgi:hypothetical protein